MYAENDKDRIWIAPTLVMANNFESHAFATKLQSSHSDQPIGDPGIQNRPLTAIEPDKIRNGKPVIRYFVSYAHKDKDQKDKLLDFLQQKLAAANNYSFEAWVDDEISPGEYWHEQIQAAIADCQFGLLLVSPAFLGSEYICKFELPAFSESEKRVIPVALRTILFDGSMNLRGLEPQQIFQGKNRKAFGQCISRRARENFALELFQEIYKIVKRYGARPHLMESET